MASKVNLRELAVERTAPTAVSRRPRKLATRYGIPAVLLIAFAAVISWSLRESFLPAKPVTITPVIIAKADVQQAGAPLFPAAGWVEPRPTATVVSAQAEGLVESLLVIEGAEVEAGQPLAKLVDVDARLALAEAKAALQLRDAEVDLAMATLTAARKNLERPVHLEAALAEAEAELAKVTTEARNLPFTLKAAEARLQIAQQELEGKQRVADAIAMRAVQRAQSEFDAATAAVNELREREDSIKQQLQSWERKCEALREQLALKTDEHRRVAEAEAGLKIAEARRTQAQLAVEAAELRLERMTVRSPVAGRILAIHAQPGQRLVGLSPSSERDASAVCSLYDPHKLQIRADVRLEDVPQTQLGQPVEITTAAIATPLRGEVIAVTSQADIQKNTLQVKIAIHDPPPVIKPEMLVQVTFLAPEEASESEHQDLLRKLIPRELVQGTKESPAVWVADLSKKVARLQPVKLGRAGTPELVEIVQGIEPTTKLIVSGRENLEDGDRIKVVGQDKNLGVRAVNTSSSLITAELRRQQ